MKDLIKKILREETSRLTDEQIKTGYVVMNNLTKGYQWYHDTPEEPFEYSEGSVWLINPDTKEWVFELEKSGKLWYNYGIPNTFYRYLNMQQSDFESFINIWVEDVFKRGVVTTGMVGLNPASAVKDVLKKGVVSTYKFTRTWTVEVEDVLKNGKQMK